MPCSVFSVRPRALRVSRFTFVFVLALSIAFAAANTGAPRAFDVPAGEAVDTLKHAARQGGVEIVFLAETVRGVRTPAVRGKFLPREALDRLVAGSGLVVLRDEKSGTLAIERAIAPPLSPPRSAEPSKKNSAMNPPSLLSRLGAALALAVGAGAAAADAQTARPAATAADTVVLNPFEVSTATEGFAANDSVSATRFNVPVAELPFSLSIVSQELLQTLGMIEIQDVLKYAANVGTNEASSFVTAENNDFRARGFSMAILRDGVPTGGGGFAVPTINIERIENLRGPASLLYGTIAPGGAVNIITKSPLAVRRTDLSATYGGFDLHRATLDTTGPVDAAKKFLYRASAAWIDQHSEKAFHHRRQYDFAPALKYFFQPGTTLAFNAAYTGKREVGQPTPPLFTNIGQNQWRFNFLYPRDFNARTDRDWIVSKVRNASLTFDHRLNAAWALRLVGDTGDSYNNFQRPAVPLGYSVAPLQRPFDITQRHNRSSRLQANALGQYEFRHVALNLLLGYDRNLGSGDFGRTRSTVQYPFVAANRDTWQHPQIDPATYTDRRDDSTSAGGNWGAYAFAQARLLDRRLLLSAGARYDYYSNDAANFLPAVPVRTHNEGHNFTPQYGGSLRLFAGVHLYAVYSEAFVPQSGVVNLPNKAGSIAPKPVLGEGGDIGLKIELLNKRALLTVARFALERTNITRNVQVTDAAGRLVDEYQVQSGTERSEGVEVGFNAKLTRGLQFINNYTYLDAKLVSDVSARASEGEALADAPKHAYSFFLRYDVQGGRLRGLYYGAGGNYRGTRDVQVPTGTEAVVPPHWLLDAVAGYGWRRGNATYSIQANVKNALNERVILNLYADDSRTDWSLTFRMRY